MKYKNKQKLKYNVLILILIIAIIGAIYIIKLVNENSFGYKNSLRISRAKEVDLDEIIKNNSMKSSYKEELLVEETELEYITKYQNTESLYNAGVFDMAYFQNSNTTFVFRVFHNTQQTLTYSTMPQYTFLVVGKWK